MLREELVFVGTCDIAGHVRGKGFPASDIEARRHKGVGWTHSNLMQTAFGPILDTPFGTGGDLMIVPDPTAEVRVDFDDGSAPEHFFLGDIRNTDGTPWECCPREFLRQAIHALEAASGLRLIAAFEQEFVYTGNQHRDGNSYSLNAFRRQGEFGESCVSAMRAAGVTPEFVSCGVRHAPVRGNGGTSASADRSRPRGDHPRDGPRRSTPSWASCVILADARSLRCRQRYAHPHQPAGRIRRAGDLRTNRPNGSQHGRTAFLRRYSGASAGDLRHHRAFTSIVSTPDPEPLGANSDRHPATGSRRGPAHLSGIRPTDRRRHGTPVQSRIPRLRWGRQSISCPWRPHLCRCRWTATQTRAASTGRRRTTAGLARRSPRPYGRQQDRRWLVRTCLPRSLSASQAIRSAAHSRVDHQRTLRALLRSVLTSVSPPHLGSNARFRLQPDGAPP